MIVGKWPTQRSKTRYSTEFPKGPKADLSEVPSLLNVPKSTLGMQRVSTWVK